MSAEPVRGDAGRARRAAEAVVGTWKLRGSPSSEYDLVWRAKEYLLDAADGFDAQLGVTFTQGAEAPCRTFGCGRSEGHDGDHSHGPLSVQLENQRRKNATARGADQ